MWTKTLLIDNVTTHHSMQVNLLKYVRTMYVKPFVFSPWLKPFVFYLFFFLGKYKSWATNDAKANARGGASKVKSESFQGFFSQIVIQHYLLPGSLRLWPGESLRALPASPRVRQRTGRARVLERRWESSINLKNFWWLETTVPNGIIQSEWCFYTCIPVVLCFNLFNLDPAFLSP